MKKLSLAEIKELDSGDIIPSFEAQITKVWEQKTGESQYGPWFLQNIDLQDGNDEIKATWAGEDPLTDKQKGAWFHFECSQSEKHGKQGLKWEVRTVNGKTYSGIKITPSAKITLLDEEPPNGGYDAADAPVARPNEPEGSGQRNLFRTRATLEAPPEKHATANDYEAARHELMRVCNAFYLIEKAVQIQVEQSHVDSIMCTPENFGGKCGTAFRHLQVKGLISSMPDKPLWSVESK